MDLSWLTTEGMSASDLIVLPSHEQRPKDPKETLNTQATTMFATLPSPACMFEEVMKRQGQIGHSQTQANTNIARSPAPPTRQSNTSRIILNVLSLLDGAITLLKPNEQAEYIRKFRIDMVRNLDNDRALYKVMGFHRKKTMTIEGMKDKILANDLDVTIDEPIWIYLSRLLQRNIYVVDIRAKVRLTVEAPSPVAHPPILYLLTTHEIRELDENNVETSLREQLRPYLPQAHEVISMTLQDIRAWVKMLDIKECKTKVAMSAALGAAFAR